ncbi:hypothetical protein LNQ81_07865 [Myroides sp. M-43]|uniref:hypothetical protein n=1 Tax=Myroides oncorhynchi TaxID=2893756 RepID=UPI001E589D4F|nr:hypothetical protein [Myroides oncorhynchi]MCC9042603.1 hypothetical protein [Myroides oncorhynchi]
MCKNVLVTLLLVLVLCVSCKDDEVRIDDNWTNGLEQSDEVLVVNEGDIDWKLIDLKPKEKEQALSLFYAGIETEVQSDSLFGMVAKFQKRRMELHQALGIPDARYFFDNPEWLPVIVPSKINYVDGTYEDAVGYYITPNLVKIKGGKWKSNLEEDRDKIIRLEQKIGEIQGDDMNVFGFLVHKPVRSIVYNGTVAVPSSHTYLISSKEPLLVTNIGEVKLLKREDTEIMLELPYDSEHYVLVYGVSEDNKVIREISRKGDTRLVHNGVHQEGRDKVYIAYSYPVEKIMIKVYKRKKTSSLSFTFEHIVEKMEVSKK